jgi:hypothetical protein
LAIRYAALAILAGGLDGVADPVAPMVGAVGRVFSVIEAAPATAGTAADASSIVAAAIDVTTNDQGLLPLLTLPPSAGNRTGGDPGTGREQE